MSARTDIKRILIIGSGPIVIGQACEFDYSGTQAVKALKEEGYEVILLNPNPATVMTTPSLADKVYMDPLKVEYVEQIFQRERPDAILTTMGGQSSLNLALELDKAGLLEQYNVEMIGSSIASIKLAEDRGAFKQVVQDLGFKVQKAMSYTHWRKQSLILQTFRILESSAPPTRWAVWEDQLPKTKRSFPNSCSMPSRPAQAVRPLSKSRSSVGRSSRWRSCGTRATMQSSSARSKTSTPWESIPGTASPSLPSRRSTTSFTRRCAPLP